MKLNPIFLLAAIPIAAFFSCQSETAGNDDDGPPLFPAPAIVPLNTTGGYTINPVTNDTLKPIINSLGDTVQTGIQISSDGKPAVIEGTGERTILKALEPLVVPAHRSMHAIPDDLVTYPVDESTLPRHAFDPAADTSGQVLINSYGDTLQTGVAVRIVGTKVAAKRPNAYMAFPFRSMDNVSCDIQYLDVDQGLISSYVTCVLEDRLGYLWFGTKGAGVCRYDGTSFLHFSDREGLSNNVVLCMEEDESGNIWFGTYGGGVSCFNGEYFMHYNEQNSFPNNNVRDIMEDSNGNIWFATAGSGACKYDGEAFTNYTVREGLSDNVVWCISEDNKGNIWFGTESGGASRLARPSMNGTGEDYFIHFTMEQGLLRNSVTSLIEDRSGNMWFGTTGGGAARYDGRQLVNLTTEQGLVNDVVWSMLEDESGNLWFGTDYGACRYEAASKLNGGKGAFIHLTAEEGLSNNYLWSIYEDGSGNIWMSTDGGGVNKYNPHTFEHFSERDGLCNPYIFSILEDREGNTWFATSGNGIIKYDGTTFSCFSHRESLRASYVRTIYEDRAGNIWLGTSQFGAVRFDGSSFEYFTPNQGMSAADVWSILEDRSGNMWFATEGGGVTKYDPSTEVNPNGTFTHYTEKEGLSCNRVWCIVEDRFGNFWMATDGGGVCKYNGESFENFTEREGLLSNFVWTIKEDSKGDLWFGTKSGLCRYDGSTFTSYTDRQGLPNNNVWSIEEDDRGDLWVSTDKGLAVLFSPVMTTDSSDAAKDKTQPLTISTFGRQEGLKGTDFYVNSVLLDSENQLWWGSGKGIEKLDLNRFSLSPKIPAPQLVTIEINETFYDYRNLPDSISEIKFSAIPDFENYPQDLVVPYSHNHITFHFTAMDWAAAYKIRYQYKLEGLSENWSLPSTETKADYRNMPYGTYTFKVRAIGESQTWGEPFAYTFTVLPPWWHTWWFRVLMFVFFVVVLILLYRWRTAAMRQRQRQLEQTVRERTAEVEEEKRIVEHQKELIEEKHKEITDSINYAERIQRSFLATKNLLDENLPDYFVFFQPKDVVSGDFYWASQLANGHFALAAADSTGHGVPGAIMSILNITCLESAVHEAQLSDPGKILDHARVNIIERLKKDGSAEGGKDGMDCSLLCFDFKAMKLRYSAANNPVLIVRTKTESGSAEIIEHDADKMPVGKHDNQHVSFRATEIQLQQGDIVYVLTDGLPDQFGGPKGKKFMYKNLKTLLTSIASEPLETQKEKLAHAFTAWKGNLEQVDDVCVIGVKI